MCPLAAPPDRGYADYQRIANWDTGVIWDETTGLTNAITLSPELNVSRSAYVGGFIFATQGQALVDFTWAADPQATVFIANRFFTVSSSVVNQTAMRIPNLGPFLQVEISPIAGAQYNVEARLLGTNRVHPLEFIPSNAALIDLDNVPLAASTVTRVYPSDYYAGPVRMVIFGSVAGMQFVAARLSQGGTWDLLDTITPAAGAWTQWTVITPPGAWSVSIEGGASAGAYYLHATASTTGAT